LSDKTGIEWCDSTWNPTTGCSLVSPGCTNCYAMKVAHRLARMPAQCEHYAGMTQESKAGPVWTGTVRLNEKALDRPLHWTRPRRIFVNSMSDLFHEALPFRDIVRVFQVMTGECSTRPAPAHTYQILTKRAERMRNFFRWLDEQSGDDPEVLALQTLYRHQGPPRNVWLGVSVEDQQRADERIPLLLETPAAVRFLSCEPLLGPVDLTRINDVPGEWRDALGGRWRREGSDRVYEVDERRLHWIIAGGESGPNARPMHPDWARSLRDQCAAAGVPFFMKQMTKKAPIPSDLFIREFPDARS
jgi:protein gp37